MISAMTDAPELAVHAQFAGVVIAIEHGADERVGAGTPLMVLEAMKMEHAIVAPRAGTVLKVNFSRGDRVPEGATLVELSDETGAGAAR
jgi:3-methylcrotonyl-CoA carboxylase alpha subunit